MGERGLTVHPADDHGLSAGDEEERDPAGTVRVHQMEEDDASLEKDRESLTFGEGELKCFSSLISIFAPDLADERQPQEEADDGDGQNQQLSGTRPAQLSREQVGNGRGQALHAHKLEGDGTVTLVTDERRGDGEKKTPHPCVAGNVT